MPNNIFIDEQPIVIMVDEPAGQVQMVVAGVVGPPGPPGSATGGGSVTSAAFVALQSVVVANSANVTSIASYLSNRIDSVFSAGGGGGGSVTSQEFSVLSARVAANSANTTSALNVISNAVSVETGARQAASATLESHINTVSAQVATNSAQMTSADNAISNAVSVETSARQAASAALESHINTVSAAVNALSITVSNQGSAIAANSADVTSLKDRVSANSALLSDTISAIQANSLDVTSLKDRVSANSATLSNAQSAIVANSAQMTSADAALSNRITSVNDTLSQRLSALVLDSLKDVSVPSPADGNVLMWNSAQAQWVASAVAAGTGSVTSTELSAAVAVETSNRISADNALSNLISALSVVVSNVNSAVVANSADVTSLKNRVSANSALLSNTISAVQANSADVTSLKDRVSANSATLSNALSAIAANSAQMKSADDAISNAVSVLSVVVSNQGSAIVANSADVTSLKNRVSANSAALSDAQSAIQANSADVTSLKNRVSAISGAVSTISADLTSTQNRISAISATVSAIKNAVSVSNKQYYSPEFNAGSAAASVVIDWDNGNVQYLSLTGNAIISTVNQKPGARYLLNLNTGSGAFSVTWPTSPPVKWLTPDNAAPAIPTSASKVAVAALQYNSALSAYIGSYGDDGPSTGGSGGSVTSTELSAAVAVETSNRISADNALSNSISALSVVVSNVNSAVQANSADVTSLKDRVSANSAALSNAQSAIQANSADVTSVKANFLSAFGTGIQLAKVTGDNSVSAAALAKISGLSLSVAANAVYQLEGMFMHTGSALSVFGFGVSTSTATWKAVTGHWWGNLSVKEAISVAISVTFEQIGFMNEASFGSVTYSALCSVNTTLGTQFKGLFAVSTTGGSIQFKAKSGGSGVITIRAGSYMRAYRLV